MSWKIEKFSSILTESKIPSESPNSDKRIRVRLNVKGVEKRPDTNDKKGATKQYIRKAGQFIYGKQNFHKGAFGIIPEELDGYETSADIPSFDVREDCLPEWIYYFFKAGNRYLELTKFARGVGSKRIHPKQISDLEIPIPPIDVQKEIIEELKIIENDKISTELTQQLDLVKQLRQSFLREAMQGKLIVNDKLLMVNEGETGAELLAKIKAEKALRQAQGHIRKQKPLPPITKEDLPAGKAGIPFEIPENWVWCRLGDACIKITDGTHHSPTNLPKGEFMYVTAKNIKSYGVDLTNITYIPKEIHNEIYSRCNPEFGDVLYIKDGATTGIVAINNLKEEFSLLSSVALLKLGKNFYNKFLMYTMRSPVYYDATRNNMFGVALTRVTLTKINNSIIPLPPLSEQKAIVEKLDELMAYCDSLEQSIKNSQNQNEMLLQQVLREALEAK